MGCVKIVDMNRKVLIQEIFDKTDFENYLEIGSRGGRSFLPLRAKNKIAIDPVFNISFFKKMKWKMKVHENANNAYFEETSDDFFLKRKDYLNKLNHIDVALVDGMHTFHAAISDALNILKYLNSNGILILHDCLPPHKAAAFPTKNHFPTKVEQASIEGWTKEWCGDVWKSIVYLRRKFPEQLEAYVLDTDYGLGIIRQKRKMHEEELIIDERAYNDVNMLLYEDMIKDANSYLGLKNVGYAQTIINEIIECNKSGVGE